MRGEFYRGKRALVVGGSQGIGLAVARRLSGLGAALLVVARQKERLDAVEQELACRTLALDVTDAEATEAALSAEVNGHGCPQLVINCAGVAFPGYLETRPLDEARRMMDLNYFGTLHVCRALLPSLMAQREGTIVNTSSLGGLMGLFGYTAYCASKYAVVGFSEALRRELKPYGVEVCLLCPPNTDTPGLARENLTKPPEVLAQEESVKTVSPEFVAEKLLRALPSRKKLVIPTFDGWLAYYLARYAPGILDRFIRRPPLSS